MSSIRIIAVTIYPKKKKKPQTSVKIAESTDRDKYEDVVFLQGDEAYEPLERLDREGPDAALEYLKQWHNPGQHMGNQELGHGSSDQTYEKDGYIMSWNSRLDYIGLQYDTQHIDENNLNEDADMYKKPPKEKNKDSMEAIKKSNARKEKLRKNKGIAKKLDENDVNEYRGLSYSSQHETL